MSSRLDKVLQRRLVNEPVAVLEQVIENDFYALRKIEHDTIPLVLKPFVDFSFQHLEEADIVPEWIKEKQRSPHLLQEWLQNNLQQHEEIDNVTGEISALERLLEKHGSLEATITAFTDLEDSLRAAKLREVRFQVEPLLKRRELQEMDVPQLRVLCIALQNELTACYSYTKCCNIIENPLVKGVLTATTDEYEQQVFVNPPVKSHLIDITKLNMVALDTRSDDIEQLRHMAGGNNWCEDRKANEMLNQLKNRLKALSRYVQSLQGEYIDGPDAVSEVDNSCEEVHPASWVGLNKMAFYRQQTQKLNALGAAISDMQNDINVHIHKLCKDIQSRDSTIEMQQDIELQLIKSKREANALNMQMASVFLRMIAHVYPTLWSKITNATTQGRCDREEIAHWEARNDEWLKKWVCLVNGDPEPQAKQQAVEVVNPPPEEVIIREANARRRTSLTSSITNAMESRRSQTQLLDRINKAFNKVVQINKQTTTALGGILKGITDHLQILSSKDQTLIDSMLELAFDTNVIPDLLSQHQIGYCFGLAEARWQSKLKLDKLIEEHRKKCADPTTSEETLDEKKYKITFWIEECARRAFPSLETHALQIHAFIKHIKSHLQSEEKRKILRQAAHAKFSGSSNHKPASGFGKPRSPSNRAAPARPRNLARPASAKPRLGHASSPRKVIAAAPTRTHQPIRTESARTAINVPLEHAVLYGVFMHYAARAASASRRQSFAEISKMSKALTSRDIIHFLSDFGIIPGILTRVMAKEMLCKLPGIFSYERFRAFLESMVERWDTRSKLLKDPFLSFYYAHESTSQSDKPTPMNVLFIVIQHMAEKLHGPWIISKGRQSYAMREKMHEVAVGTPSSSVQVSDELKKKREYATLSKKMRKPSLCEQLAQAMESHKKRLEKKHIPKV